MEAIIQLIEGLQAMTAGEIAGNATLLLVGLSAFVEITPIKFNPITAVLQWIGNKFNGPVMDKLSAQDKAMVEIRDVVDDNEIDRIRWEILDFANSCRQGKKHTRDEFVHIVELNAKYHKILERRKLTNGVIDLEYNYIVKIYEECQAKDSFL